MSLDTYYQHCEDAVRCQAAGLPLGVFLHLTEAAKIRDVLVGRARARLEFGLIRGVLDYWEGTLKSLPYAERTGKAGIYIPLDMEPEEDNLNTVTLRCIVMEPEPLRT